MNNTAPLAPFAGALEHLPQGCRLHAPSWDPRHAGALAQEVAIHRLHVTPAKGRTPWPPGGPIWARERFCRRRTAAGLVAYSTDSRGRIIRGWFSNPTDHAAYAAGGAGMPGPLTCPIEAVWLELLAPGLPGFPGHLFIGAERQWPGYCAVAADLRSIWQEHYAERSHLVPQQFPEMTIRKTCGGNQPQWASQHADPEPNPVRMAFLLSDHSCQHAAHQRQKQQKEGG